MARNYFLCKKINITILADVFDWNNVKFLNNLGVDGFKIHTTDINNLKFIDRLASINKPIFLSVGHQI